MLFKSQKEYYYEYSLPLARALWKVQKRGILVDQTKLSQLQTKLKSDAQALLDEMSTLAQVKVIDGKSDTKEKGALNINSGKQLGNVLRQRGLKLKINRKTKSETVAKDALYIMFIQSGDQLLQKIIDYRQIKTMDKYLYAKLTSDGALLYSFNTAGTVNDRRSSSESTLGYGTNGQNFPKHSKLGKGFRECLISRPGKIFIQCDQSQAEDWVVQSIIADVSQGRITQGLDELKTKADRHRILASKLFGKPQIDCGKETIERYLGKKTRHAGNYGMQEETMSISLAKEQKFIPIPICKKLLNIFHSEEPQIQNIFQKWVQEQLQNNHKLVTPTGYVRQALGLRLYGNNSKVFREFYSTIPQNTVCTNTGLCILSLNDSGYIQSQELLKEDHDSVLLEVDDTPEAISKGYNDILRGFNRQFIFPVSQLSLQIPVDFEIGYSLGTLKDMKVSCEKQGIS